MKSYTLSVEVGYELRTVCVTSEELRLVRSGVVLSKEIDDYYEGETCNYLFKFNQDPQHSLIVTYQDGVGFLGDIDDALIQLKDSETDE